MALEAEARQHGAGSQQVETLHGIQMASMTHAQVRACVYVCVFACVCVCVCVCVCPSSSHPWTPSSSLPISHPQVMLGYLSSYENIGSAMVRCTSGCTCDELKVDALWAQRMSATAFLYMTVSAHPK
jgi:hypothetical protein